MSKGLETTRNYFDLWGRYSSCLPCYKSNERQAVCCRVILAVPSAIMKTFLFPVACLVGVIAFPMIALGSCCKSARKSSKYDCDQYMTATVFCFLGLGATVGFGATIAFARNFTMKAALGVVAAAVTISITYHVWRAVAQRG